MATVYYIGKAVAVAQVSSVSIGANDVATTYALTVNGVSVSTLGGANSMATATALVAAWNASTHPYFSIATAAVDTSTSPSVDITITGDEAGFPFTVTSSATGGSGAISSVTTTTAATGPNHFDNVDNWSAGTVPTNADDVIVAFAGARICWNIDLSGPSPDDVWTSLVVQGNARIGLSFSGVATSADGDTVSADAPEYRYQYLKISITTVTVQADPSIAVVTGSGRLHINNIASSASTTTIAATAQSAADTTRPAVCLLFSSANADLYVTGGRSGVGVGKGNPGETGTVGDIVVDDSTGSSRVYVGDGITHSTFTMVGGRAELDAAATMPAITVDGGDLWVQGTQAVTAMTVNNGAAVRCETTGTVTTLNQNDDSFVDFRRSGKARTVTTYNYFGGRRGNDTRYLTITTDNRSGRILESITT